MKTEEAPQEVQSTPVVEEQPVENKTVEVPPVPVEKLITKEISQMALLSSDLESGYSLQRELSGSFDPKKDATFYDAGLKYVKKAFALEFGKEYDDPNELRILSIYLFSFDSVDSAKDAFADLEKHMQGKPKYKKINYVLKDIEEYGAYKREYYEEYEYLFSQFKYITVNLREKNVVGRVYLNANTKAEIDFELKNYLAKLVERINSEEKIKEEVSEFTKVKPWQPPTYPLKLTVKDSRKSSTLNVKHGLYAPDLPTLTGDKTHLIVTVAIQNNGVTGNQGAGFDAGFYSFVLEDKAGNLFYPTMNSQVIEEYKEGLSIKPGSSGTQTIVFPVLSASTWFNMTASDENGVEVGTAGFNP